MKAKMMVAAVLALFLSAGAYAQSQTDVSRPRLTPEQRAARKAERKAKLAQMTPQERKAFKQAHREQRQARLNAMTPEQRERFMARKRQHKGLKQQQG